MDGRLLLGARNHFRGTGKTIRLVFSLYRASVTAQRSNEGFFAAQRPVFFIEHRFENSQDVVLV
jgi:hypothetical protein